VTSFISDFSEAFGQTFPNAVAGDLFQISIETDAGSILTATVDVVETKMPVISSVSLLSSNGSIYSDADGKYLDWTWEEMRDGDSISLSADDAIFSFFGLNLGQVSGDYLPPSISVELAEAIDTSSSEPIVEKLVLELIQDNNNNGRFDESIDRLISGGFEVERTGDGSTEIWTSKAGSEMKVAMTALSGTTAEVVVINQDTDQFSLSSNGQSSVIPDSLFGKINKLLQLVDDDNSLPIPHVQAGEHYIANLNLVDEANNGVEEILSLRIDVI
jgi:hypothetical protein